MNLPLSRRNLIYIIFAVVILLIFISFIFTELTTKPKVPLPVPTPQPQGPQPNIEYEISTPENIAKRKQGQRVSQLLKKLPYKGSNFTVSYSYSTFTFTLSIVKGKEEVGQQEFDSFLKENQIEDRSWLDKLVVGVY